MNIREELAAAGKTHDGHVTNGSLNAQMKVVKAFVEELYMVARGGPDRFGRLGAMQQYWKGRSDAAREIRERKP